MTEKQEAFCREYLIDYNATQAAIRAGYSEKGANGQGTRLLANASIKSRLAELKAERDAEYENRLAGAMEIKAFLAAAMRGEIEEEVVVNIGDGLGFSRAETMTKKISARDRLKAAETLARAEALFQDRVKIDSAVPVVITGDADIRE